MNKPIMTIQSEAYDALLRYSWPGNVRQLQNVIERAVVLTQGSLITPRSLPQEVLHNVPHEVPPAPGGVNVTVDHLAKPGAIVSGKVTFSDGQSADWYLDQDGRVRLAPKVAGYKLTAADAQQFQLSLQTELARLGF